MRCVHCGQDTAYNAQICPSCGASPPHGGNSASGAITMILGGFLATFILGKFFGVW